MSALHAFYATTALLSLLPLALVGGLVYWLYRRSRELSEETAGEVDPPLDA